MAAKIKNFCPHCRVTHPHLNAACEQLAQSTRMLESLLRMYPLEIGILPMVRMNKLVLAQAKDEAAAKFLEAL
jgi:hypothetical protein